MHAIGNGAPLLDERNDVELLNGHENGTHTVFTFRRPLRSCDTKHDLELGVSTVCMSCSMFIDHVVVRTTASCRFGTASRTSSSSIAATDFTGCFRIFTFLFEFIFTFPAPLSNSPLRQSSRILSSGMRRAASVGGD